MPGEDVSCGFCDAPRSDISVKWPTVKVDLDGVLQTVRIGCKCEKHDQVWRHGFMHNRPCFTTFCGLVPSDPVVSKEFEVGCDVHDGMADTRAWEPEEAIDFRSMGARVSYAYDFEKETAIHERLARDLPGYNSATSNLEMDNFYDQYGNPCKGMFSEPEHGKMRVDVYYEFGLNHSQFKHRRDQKPVVKNVGKAKFNAALKDHREMLPKYIRGHVKAPVMLSILKRLSAEKRVAGGGGKGGGIVLARTMSRHGTSSASTLPRAEGVANAPSASAVGPAAAAPDAGARHDTGPESCDDTASEDGSEEENFSGAVVVALAKADPKDVNTDGFAPPVRRQHNSNGGS